MSFMIINDVVFHIAATTSQWSGDNDFLVKVISFILNLQICIFIHMAIDKCGWYRQCYSSLLGKTREKVNISDQI